MAQGVRCLLGTSYMICTPPSYCLLTPRPITGSSSSLSRQVTTSSNHGRRRSQVLMNLQLNDPSLPGPGEMVQESRGSVTSPGATSTSPLMLAGGDPHHNRAPSLGELHQELEAEQEAQVNRLLGQIRQQQAQIMHLQQNQSAIAGEDSPGNATPALSAQSIPAASHPPSVGHTAPSSGSLPRSPVLPRSSFDIARGDLRHRSRTPSRGASPRVRSTSISQDSAEPFALGGRDEGAFYQAETQMLMRENQMLRHRIRDLGTFCSWVDRSRELGKVGSMLTRSARFTERQLDSLNGGTGAITHEPTHHSALTRSESVSEEARPSGAATTSGSEANLPIRELPKEE